MTEYDSHEVAPVKSDIARRVQHFSLELHGRSCIHRIALMLAFVSQCGCQAASPKEARLDRRNQRRAATAGCLKECAFRDSYWRVFRRVPVTNPVSGDAPVAALEGTRVAGEGGTEGWVLIASILQPQVKLPKTEYLLFFVLKALFLSAVVGSCQD